MPDFRGANRTSGLPASGIRNPWDPESRSDNISGLVDEILWLEDQRADQAADGEAIGVDRVPEPLVQGTLVGGMAQLAAEVEDEVGVDHRAEEAIFLLGPERERLHPLARERVR